jgi:enterochelin esterase-like enzyme
MKKRLTRSLAAAAVLAAAILAVHGPVVYGSKDVRQRAPAGQLLRVTFFSPALEQRRAYLIYLPPGYAAAAARGQRFPVFYFLHGSPASPTSVVNGARLVANYDVLLHAHRIRPFLMVMPDGRNGTQTSDTEWANTRHDGRYASFVMDVVHAVDARWATIPQRQDRMIAGFSEGAYAALNLSLHDLAPFGSLEAWSGYTSESDTAGPFAREPLALIHANEPNLYLQQVAGEVRRMGLRAYLYTGKSDSSRRQVAAYAHELRAAGAKVTFTVFPGGHNWRVWRAHSMLMVEWASKVLSSS